MPCEGLQGEGAWCLDVLPCEEKGNGVLRGEQPTVSERRPLDAECKDCNDIGCFSERMSNARTATRLGSSPKGFRIQELQRDWAVFRKNVECKNCNDARWRMLTNVPTVSNYNMLYIRFYTTDSIHCLTSSIIITSIVTLPYRSLSSH